MKKQTKDKVITPKKSIPRNMARKSSCLPANPQPPVINMNTHNMIEKEIGNISDKKGSEGESFQNTDKASTTKPAKQNSHIPVKKAPANFACKSTRPPVNPQTENNLTGN